MKAHIANAALKAAKIRMQNNILAPSNSTLAGKHSRSLYWPSIETYIEDNSNRHLGKDITDDDNDTLDTSSKHSDEEDDEYDEDGNRLVPVEAKIDIHFNLQIGIETGIKVNFRGRNKRLRYHPCPISVHIKVNIIS